MLKRIINPWEGMAGYNCIGCSPDNPIGLHLCFYEDGDDIVTRWRPRPTTRDGSTRSTEAYRPLSSTRSADGS